MIFGNRNMIKKNKNITVKLNDENLQTVPTFKYLGFTLDSTLSYNQHINNVSRNAHHKLYQLRRINTFLTKDTSLMIFKSYILPIIEYGNVIYNSASEKSLSKLQRLQNQSIKLCLNLDKMTPTATIHKLANLNTLKDRREKATIKFMFNRTKHSKFHDTSNYNIQTRSSTVPKLKVPEFRSSKARNAILYSGSILWNKLNQNIKEITNKSKFSRKIDTLFKTKINNYM